MTVNKADQRVYQAIALETYGPMPVMCERCNTLVLELRGNEGVVHHKNFDRKDHSPENLEIIHHTCHTRLHRSVPHTEEAKAKISATMNGRKHTAEHNENVRKAVTGKVRNEEQRANISVGANRQARCECGKVTTRSAISRHATKSDHLWENI